jgi:hypothetical protein
MNVFSGAMVFQISQLLGYLSRRVHKDDLSTPHFCEDDDACLSKLYLYFVAVIFKGVR